MRGYNWYEEISYSGELSQGDLIYDCPIPVPSSGVYQELKQFESGSGWTAEIEEPAFHLLNEYTSGNIKMSLSVVEFHRLYALPKEYLQSVASDTALRLRLLPPYREPLSQAFARYFMRVGLPIDIPKERVKNYN